MVPKVSIGAIRGGQPFKPSMNAKSCSIYLDVRIPPSLDLSVVQEELRKVVLSQGLGGEIECFMFRKGYEGKNVQPLVDAIGRAYNSIRRHTLPAVSSENISVWRDSNIFSELGIPAVNFAPPRKRASGLEEEFVEVQDLLDSSKMYALIALDICGL
jgi:acetylornithine deacetylase/succinyl-diaminopimelate desuccinylase-like protein